MSLQLKFSLLLAALAAAVLVALAAAEWSLDVTYREIREPVQSASSVLRKLVQIEKHVDELRGLASPTEAFSATEALSRPTPSQAVLNKQNYLEHEQGMAALLQAIEAEFWTTYAGKSATRNVRAKFAELRDLGRAYTGLPPEPPYAADADPRRAATASASPARISVKLFQIHELLKRMEDRVIDDLEKLASAGADLRWRLRIVLGLALGLVVLTAGLGYLLMRRWVSRPVATLRGAAARIASGDFEHRIDIPASAPRDELTLLSTEVNHMAGMVKQLQVERVEQERLAAVGEMVRRLAHNLRNPLAGIRGLAEISLSDTASLGPAAGDVREAQTRIIASVDRFEKWLQDLLDVTKPTQIHTEAIDVPQWLTGLVEAHRPLAQTRGVKLELEHARGPHRATLDSRHLEHAVSAILSNAIEATAASATKPPTPLVRVTSRLVQDGQPGQTWELRVEDDGPGVPPDLREAIFKPYFTTKKDGNGIGLAVAQQVVRAHGGRIHVEDAADGEPTPAAAHGAAFVIRLPLDGGPAGATEVARIGQ